jgi:Zn-dependent oligopeptidase
MEDLNIFAKDSGSPEATDLTHWDLTFWSERLRESKYDINEVCSSFHLAISIIPAASSKVSFSLLLVLL